MNSGFSGVPAPVGQTEKTFPEEEIETCVLELYTGSKASKTFVEEGEEGRKSGIRVEVSNFEK